MLEITETKDSKKVSSSNYNYFFDKKTGYFERYGATKEEDPTIAPGPEIADIEVTTICNGVNGKLCKHCYKSNTPKGNNMSLDTFKKIFDAISKNRILTQIAFGADASATANPDLFKMMKYSRDNGVVPNITVADISDEIAEKLASVCGAVAVSRYKDKAPCYNSIQKLSKYGLDQINIHLMISEETYETAIETLYDRIRDSRIENVKAIVALSLKQKGRGDSFHSLPQREFDKFVKLAISNNIRLGFDSCSAIKFMRSIQSHHNFNNICQYIEPCESTLFSVFINYLGEAYPCSFSEGCADWDDGINVLDYPDTFIDDIWNSNRFDKFRNTLLNTENNNKFSCRECPLYKI